MFFLLTIPSLVNGGTRVLTENKLPLPDGLFCSGGERGRVCRGVDCVNDEGVIFNVLNWYSGIGCCSFDIVSVEFCSLESCRYVAMGIGSTISHSVPSKNDIQCLEELASYSTTSPTSQ